MLVCRDGRFLMVRQGEHWLPPGGTPEPGEDPATTARRELREEIGVEVELLGELGTVTSPRGRATRVFAGRVTGQPRAGGLPGEGITAVAWLAPEDPVLDGYARALLALHAAGGGGPVGPRPPGSGSREPH